MIEIPSNPLAERLEKIKDPKEHDRVLSAIWKKFAGSEAHQALERVLYLLEAQLLGRVLGPSTADDRAFNCGQLGAIHLMQQHIKQFINFDPEKGDYGEQGVETDAGSEPGSPDPSEILY